MACGHHFHIGCLGRWLLKNESCPYCRHEAVEHERIEDDASEDSDSLDDESEYESDHDGEWIRAGNGRWISVVRRQARLAELPIPEYDEEAHALWVWRTTMEQLEAGAEIAPMKVLPVPKIELPEIKRDFYDYLADPHDGYHSGDD